MANSPLDFPSTQTFRTRLVARNLAPYPKSPNRPDPPFNFPIIQSDYEVIDSPDQLIDQPTLANELYPLNQYGSDGGYRQTRDVNVLNNTNSNEGEYGVNDAEIILQAFNQANKPGGWKVLNAYGDGTSNVIDSSINFSSFEVLQINNGRTGNSQPYPTTFVPSFYRASNILLSDNPRGTNGNLSQDSFIAKLGAKVLRREFQDRIAAELRRQTLGRANFLNTNSTSNLVGIITGTIPLLQPNYQITVPANPISYAAEFALRLAGGFLPVSPIPGSYFDSSINPGQPTTIQQITNAFNNTVGQTGVGQVISALLGSSKTGSQLFLNNTGRGQKSRLFLNIDYNIYKPGYDRTLLDRLGGAIFGTSVNNSNYYIGSTTSEPSRIFSPSGDLPGNEFGKEVQAPVYGPSKLAQLYEGETSKQIKLGANGPIYSNGGGIEGGMTWVSPKYKQNAGKKVGQGGEIVRDDNDFKESSFLSTESTNLDFRDGSILDETQRLINSQPQGGKRLEHVGNAIDQVSKVFNDGYKEMTKGSRVLAYIGEIGQERGAEYCRVFAKDTPYLQYNDLQKTDGMTTEGRRFSYSVLDKTYNLNMYPNKREGGQDSTNLVGGTGEEGRAKKYMFSLENLAWRTSNKPGYTVSDLPVCERGPNGGRVMWFPPYDLKFTESSSANWKGTDFLGRPEPVYTYNNTSRSGTLSWKIVVDHPSVLNVIVDKVLANETNKTRVDSILESFFAGCRKYDLYELAKKYYTVNPNDIFEIQKELQYRDVSTERIRYIKDSITTGEDGTPDTKTSTKAPPTIDVNKYKNLGFYFHNDIPLKKQTVGSFEGYYNQYLGLKTTYSNNSPTTTTPYSSSPGQTANFFTDIVEDNFTKLKEMAGELLKLLSTNPKATATLELIGSASSPQTKTYNVELSKRRVESVTNWLKSYKSGDVSLSSFIDGSPKRLIIQSETRGEQTSVSPTGKQNFGSYSCTDGDKDTNQSSAEKIFTVNAMACRRVGVNLTVNENAPDVETIVPGKPNTKQTTQFDVPQKYTETTQVPEEVTRTVIKDNITKRVLRSLLSECDYFETIKEETPMVYDNLKEKLKFFHPAFHSTTPEGLNSRLTFLQQCLRPGDTIPVVQKGGELQYNNATNTAFGAPPVLILRVGDFYHTKIIPDNLNITYEGLDMNPEGIGIQPMIANITMSFKFVGGHGLAGAVDRIQNALTFNYYANTEMYDDRADVTDTSYQVLDKDFLNYFNISVPPPTVNQVQNNPGQTNGQTIGVITSATTLQSGEVGDINYQGYMNGFLGETQNYFTNVVNKNREVFRQFNNAVRQMWTFNRDYQTGKILYTVGNVDTYLFGKPKNVEVKINEVFNDFITDINNDSDGLISFIKGTPGNAKNFSDKVITALKENYKKYISTTKKNNFQSALTKIIQDFTIVQQNYLQQISKANTVTYQPLANRSGTDGFQQSNGFVKLYLISGTTKIDPSSIPTPSNTFVELENDIIRIREDLNKFDTLTKNKVDFTFEGKAKNGKLIYNNTEIPKNDVFVPFTDNVKMNNPSFRRSYFILNDDIVDDAKYTAFKNQIIGSILSNSSLFGNGNTELEREFDAYWKNEVKPVFVDENKITEQFFNELTTKTLKDYLVYTPFSKTKKREFVFTTTIEGGEEAYTNNRNSLIKSLGASNNTNNNKLTWNDLINAVYIGKVKLN
jgi:hypothetical protein